MGFESLFIAHFPALRYYHSVSIICMTLLLTFQEQPTGPLLLQIGKTKVFLRAGQMAELDARRSEVLGRAASMIQRKVRSYFCRKRYILLQQSAIDIQAMCRGIII